ncbi:MAG: peptide chain release factor N(5)-glutamine methyltransferase [Candidatus Erginobacter occultus]|nr:peptide chain release factor N(5)-glutamine methyltransferase [Candidatus Erginobacter occultus]
MPQTLAEIPTVNSKSSIGDVLRDGEESLAAAGVENPRLDAEHLLAHCLGIEPWRLLLERERVLNPAQEAQFQLLLEARRLRRPLAYILGEAGFYDLVLSVDPRALIPRPETELLVEKALQILEGTTGPEVIEIGCGSGAIVLALARRLPSGRIGASDVSQAALDLAKENAARLGLEGRIDFRPGDLFAPWPDRRGRGVDLVVANPPYLSREELDTAPPEVRDYEPREALEGGEDGLAVIRRLVGEAADYLRPGGRLLFEIGSGQGQAVRELSGPAAPVIARSEATKQSQLGSNSAGQVSVEDCFAPSAPAMTDSVAAGLELIELAKDYCGRDRVAVFGRRNG